MIENYRDFYQNSNIIHKQILDNINEHNGFRIALIDNNEKVDYLSFKRNVVQLANFLITKGIKKGDVVEVEIENIENKITDIKKDLY